MTDDFLLTPDTPEDREDLRRRTEAAVERRGALPGQAPAEQGVFEVTDNRTGKSVVVEGSGEFLAAPQPENPFVSDEPTDLDDGSQGFEVFQFSDRSFAQQDVEVQDPEFDEMDDFLLTPEGELRQARTAEELREGVEGGSGQDRFLSLLGGLQPYLDQIDKDPADWTNEDVRDAAALAKADVEIQSGTIQFGEVRSAKYNVATQIQTFRNLLNKEGGLSAQEDLVPLLFGEQGQTPSSLLAPTMVALEDPEVELTFQDIENPIDRVMWMAGKYATDNFSEGLVEENLSQAEDEMLAAFGAREAAFNKELVEAALERSFGVEPGTYDEDELRTLQLAARQNVRGMFTTYSADGVSTEEIEEIYAQYSPEAIAETEGQQAFIDAHTGFAKSFVEFNLAQVDIPIETYISEHEQRLEAGQAPIFSQAEYEAMLAYRDLTFTSPEGTDFTQEFSDTVALLQQDEIPEGAIPYATAGDAMMDMLQRFNYAPNEEQSQLMDKLGAYYARELGYDITNNSTLAELHRLTVPTFGDGQAYDAFGRPIEAGGTLGRAGATPGVATTLAGDALLALGTGVGYLASYGIEGGLHTLDALTFHDPSGGEGYFASTYNMQEDMAGISRNYREGSEGLRNRLTPRLNAIERAQQGRSFLTTIDPTAERKTRAGQITDMIDGSAVPNLVAQLAGGGAVRAGISGTGKAAGWVSARVGLTAAASRAVAPVKEATVAAGARLAAVSGSRRVAEQVALRAGQGGRIQRIATGLRNYAGRRAQELPGTAAAVTPTLVFGGAGASAQARVDIYALSDDQLNAIPYAQTLKSLVPGISASDLRERVATREAASTFGWTVAGGAVTAGLVGRGSTTLEDVFANGLSASTRQGINAATRQELRRMAKESVSRATLNRVAAESVQEYAQEAVSAAAAEVTRGSGQSLFSTIPSVISTAVTSPDAQTAGIVGAILGGGLTAPLGARAVRADQSTAQSLRTGQVRSQLGARSVKRQESIQRATFEAYQQQRKIAGEAVAELRANDSTVDIVESLSDLDNVTLLDALMRASQPGQPVEAAGALDGAAGTLAETSRQVTFSSYVPPEKTNYYGLPESVLPLYTESPGEGSIAVFQDVDGFYVTTGQSSLPVRTHDSQGDPVSLRHKDTRLKLKFQKGITTETLGRVEAVVKLAKYMGRTYEPSAMFPSVHMIDVPSLGGLDSATGVTSDGGMVVATKRGMFVETAEGDIQVADAQGFIDPELLQPEVAESLGLSPEQVQDIQSAIGIAISEGRVDTSDQGNLADALNAAEDIMNRAVELRTEAAILESQVEGINKLADVPSPKNGVPNITDLGEVSQEARALNSARGEVAAMKAEASYLESESQQRAFQALNETSRALAARVEEEVVYDDEGTVKVSTPKSLNKKAKNLARFVGEDVSPDDAISRYKGMAEGYMRTGLWGRFWSAYASQEWIPGYYDAQVAASYREATGEQFPEEYQSSYLLRQEALTNANDLRINDKLVQSGDAAIRVLEDSIRQARRDGLGAFLSGTPETIEQEANKLLEAMSAIETVNILRGIRSAPFEGDFADIGERRDKLLTSAESGEITPLELRETILDMYATAPRVRDYIHGYTDESSKQVTGHAHSGVQQDEAAQRIAHMPRNVLEAAEKFFDINEEINNRINALNEEAGVTNDVGRMIIQYEGPRYHLPMRDARHSDNKNLEQSEIDVGIITEDTANINSPAVRNWKGFERSSGRSTSAANDGQLYLNQVTDIHKAARRKNLQNRLRGERAQNNFLSQPIEKTGEVLTFDGKPVLNSDASGLRSIQFHDEQTTQLFMIGELKSGPKKGHTQQLVWDNGTPTLVTITDADVALTFSPGSARGWKKGVIESNITEWVRKTTRPLGRGFTQLNPVFWPANFLRVSLQSPLRMAANIAQHVDRHAPTTRRGRESWIKRTGNRALAFGQTVRDAQVAIATQVPLIQSMIAMEPGERLAAANKSKNATMVALAEYMNEVGTAESELQVLDQSLRNRRISRFQRLEGERSGVLGLFDTVRSDPTTRNVFESAAQVTSPVTSGIGAIATGYAKLGRAAVTLPEMAHRAAMVRVMSERGVPKKQAIAIAQGQINFAERSVFSDFIGPLFTFARAGTAGFAGAVRQSIFSASEQGLPVEAQTIQGRDSGGRAVERVRVGFSPKKALTEANYGAFAAMVGAGAALQFMRMQVWEDMYGDEDEVIELDENGKEVRRSRLDAIDLNTWLTREVIPGAKPGQLFSVPLEYGEFTLASAIGKAAALIYSGVADEGEVITTLVRKTIPENMGLVIGVPEVSTDVGSMFAGLFSDSSPSGIAPLTQLALNRNFMGGPIYRPTDPRREDVAEYTRAFGSTAPIWTESSRILYESSGGRIDLNPEAAAHLTRTYAIGVGPIVDKLSKIIRDVGKSGGPDAPSIYGWAQHAGLGYDGSTTAHYRQLERIRAPMNLTLRNYNSYKESDNLGDWFTEDQVSKLEVMQSVINKTTSWRIPDSVADEPEYRQQLLDELTKLIQEYQSL